MSDPPRRLRERLQQAAHLLQAVSDSPRLDAELLMAHCVGRNRTWLMTWPEHELTEAQQQCFEKLLERRLGGEPVAYLLGEREFWSMSLKVTPATLVPRPETELLVERALVGIEGRPAPRILELGTGSGAIALALQRERPDATITAIDSSSEALAVARENAARLDLPVQFIESDWFAAIDPADGFDLVVSNPPYIAADDPWLKRGDLPAEPQQALCSGPGGLEAIEIIVASAPEYLGPGAMLALEHGHDQREAVQRLMRQAGFEAVATFEDFNALPRVTEGRRPG